jgi:hypothetical protein
MNEDELPELIAWADSEGHAIILTRLCHLGKSNATGRLRNIASRIVRYLACPNSPVPRLPAD